MTDRHLVTPFGDAGENIFAPPDDPFIPTLKVTSRSAGKWLVPLSWILLLVGILLTIVIAIVGSKDARLDLLPIISLTVCSGLFQVMSVVVSGQAGRLDRLHIRNMVRNAIAVRSLAASIRVNSESGFDVSAKNSGSRIVFGQMSVQASMIEDHLVGAVEAWRDLAPEEFEKEKNGR